MNPFLRILSRRSAVALVGIVTGALSLGSMAHAQTWLPDRSYTEGPGFRTGDLEVHPGVAVRGGYDSNVFRADGKARTEVVGGQTRDVTQPIQGSGILAVTPHIHLSTLSEQRLREGEDRTGAVKPLPVVAFRGGAAATYFHYFTANAPRNLEIDTDLWVGILPQRPFNIDINVAYVRNVRPFTQDAFNRNAYNFNAIVPRVRFNFGSRSQVLTGYVGYAPRVTLFESDVFNYLNNTSHGLETGASWRFLPNTAFIYDANADLQYYREEDPFNTRSPIVFANGTRFRTRLGLNGAITRRLAARALVGYALIRFDRSNDGQFLDDDENVIGEAALTYSFGSAGASRFELGYTRDLVLSALGGWARWDRGYTRISSLLGRVFLLTLEGGLSRVRYGKLLGYDKAVGAMPVGLGTGDETDRKDIRVDGAVRGEYRLTNWLSLMADVTVQALVTDFQYAVFAADGGAPIPDPAQYFTVMAFGGLRAHY